MRTFSNSRTFAAIASSLLLSACGAAPEEETSPAGSTEHAIINGTPLDPEGSGRVLIRTLGGTLCSGTLLTNDIVMTASHCFTATDLATPSRVTLTMGSQVRTSLAIRATEAAREGYRASDTALVLMSAPMRMNGSTTGYDQPLYLGNLSALLNQVVFCTGYGVNTTGGSGAGTLRGAWLRVRSVAADSITTEANGSLQLQWRGDSGGTCHLGNLALGVNSYISGSPTTATLMTSHLIRPWFDLNRAQLTQQGGDTCDLSYTRTATTCTSASTAAPCDAGDLSTGLLVETGVALCRTPTLVYPQSIVTRSCRSSRQVLCERVRDGGFETQSSRSILDPWFGDASGGIDIDLGLQYQGRKNGWVRAASGWHALNQWVDVRPNTRYRAEAFLRTSGNVSAGFFSVRDSAGTILNEVQFGPFATYQGRSFEFNSGPSSRVLLYAGHHAPGADSWIQVDNVSVKPAW